MGRVINRSFGYSNSPLWGRCVLESLGIRAEGVLAGFAGLSKSLLPETEIELYLVYQVLQGLIFSLHIKGLRPHLESSV